MASKKIIIVKGSPRKKGNSATLAKPVAGWPSWIRKKWGDSGSKCLNIRPLTIPKKDSSIKNRKYFSNNPSRYPRAHARGTYLMENISFSF